MTNILNKLSHAFPGWDFDVFVSPLTGMTTLTAASGEFTYSRTSNDLHFIVTDMVQSLLQRSAS